MASGVDKFPDECPEIRECSRQDIIDLTRAILHGHCSLNEWEQGFVRSVHYQMVHEKIRRPTTNQSNILDRVLPKLWADDPRLWGDDDEAEAEAMAQILAREERRLKTNEPFLKPYNEEDDE